MLTAQGPHRARGCSLSGSGRVVAECRTRATAAGRHRNLVAASAARAGQRLQQRLPGSMDREEGLSESPPGRSGIGPGLAADAPRTAPSA